MVTENGEKDIVIIKYTRAEAIADGVLVDVSPDAVEAGIRIPCAMTRRVWDDVVVPDARAKQYGESIEGRLWDVVWMLAAGIRRSSAAAPTDRITFRLYATFNGQRRLLSLKAMCGPGDRGEPVLTVMFPEED